MKTPEELAKKVYDSIMSRGVVSRDFVEKVIAEAIRARDEMWETKLFLAKAKPRNRAL